jgi:hypothetical protein
MITRLFILNLEIMMKTFMALIFLCSSLTASAQQSGRNRGESGRIVLRDGQTTVRISVNDNDQLQYRVRLLEEAVRDLQAQVYDLRDSEQRTRIIKTFVCSMVTPFNGTFIGKASTKTEAEAITRQKCSIARVSFCSSNVVNCEAVTEEVVIR